MWLLHRPQLGSIHLRFAYPGGSQDHLRQRAQSDRLFNRHATATGAQVEMVIVHPLLHYHHHLRKV